MHRDKSSLQEQLLSEAAEGRNSLLTSAKEQQQKCKLEERKKISFISTGSSGLCL